MERPRPFPAAAPYVVPLLVLVNLVICAYFAATLNIWVDEAYSLHTTQSGMRYALGAAVHFENQAPMYFSLLALWRSLDHSVFFARLFSMLCIAGALFALAAVARERRLPESWMVAAAAFNPIMIVLAVEIRVYALTILLSTLLLLAFFKGFWTERPDRRWQWIYFGLALLGLYTQYFIAFLLCAQALVLIVKRGRWMWFFLAGMAVVLIAFIPLAIAVRQQMGVTQANSGPPSTFAQNGVQLLVALMEYVFPLIVRHHAVQTLAVMAVVALAVLAAGRFRFAAAQWAPVPVTIAIAAFLMLLVVTQVGSYQINDRYAAFLLTPAVFATFSYFEYVRFERKQWCIGVFTIVSIATGLWGLWTLFGSGAKSGDWKRVAAYVESHERPGQPILIFPASQALPLAHYYNGLNAVIPIPRAIRFQNWNARQNVLVDAREIRKALSPSERAAPALWLLRYDECSWAAIDYNCHALDEFVRRHYTLQASQAFVGTRVELLRRVH
ncbi:MAG: hypothetical protein ACR2KS_11555 [Candidatus Eremiobacter antarcticus]